MLGVELVYVLTELAQAHAFVAAVLLAKFWHDAPHGLVAVVVVLELLQGGEQGVPAAFGDADGEHDEEAVEAGFFDNDAVLGEKFGDDAGGNAAFVKLAIKAEPRGDDGGFDWVEHVEAVCQCAKAVPFVAVLFVAAADDPVGSSANAGGGKGVWPPDLEPPVVGAKIGFDFAHGTAKVECFGNAFFDHGGAAGRFHHGGGNVATGDDAVLRAGGGVH